MKNKKNEEEKKKNILLIYLKGFLMGLFDLVPGISGGTIALITGIYEDLITQINEAFTFIKETLMFNFKKAQKKWYELNKTFLIILVIGIITGIITSVIFLSYLLLNFFSQTMGAITGIILIASIIMIKKNVKSTKSSLIGAVGTIIGIVLSIITPTTGHTFNYIQVLLLGSITIIAMILPGISGALILLLLGGYEYMIVSLRNFTSEYLTIIFFIIGGLIGLSIFSKIIKYLLKKHHDETMSFLSCLMLGAITKPILEIINYGNIDSGFIFFGLSAILSVYFYRKRK